MPERHSDFRPPRHAYLRDLLLRCVLGRPSFVASLTVVFSLLHSRVVRLLMLRISGARKAALPTAYACFDVLRPGRLPCPFLFLRCLRWLGFSVGYCRTRMRVSAAVLAWVTQDFCFCRLRMSRWLSTWRDLGFVEEWLCSRHGSRSSCSLGVGARRGCLPPALRLLACPVSCSEGQPTLHPPTRLWQ